VAENENNISHIFKLPNPLKLKILHERIFALSVTIQVKNNKARKSTSLPHELFRKTPSSHPNIFLLSIDANNSLHVLDSLVLELSKVEETR
jgi:hypothetical protein